MKTAGKVMVVVAMVLALGMVAASDLSAASRSNKTAPSTDGAVWGGGGSGYGGGGLLTQPVHRGQQHELSTQDRGCFSGTASENARCIARGLVTKMGNLLDGAIWGGGFTPPPPR